MRQSRLCYRLDNKQLTSAVCGGCINLTMAKMFTTMCDKHPRVTKVTCAVYQTSSKTISKVDVNGVKVASQKSRRSESGVVLQIQYVIQTEYKHIFV